MNLAPTRPSDRPGGRQRAAGPAGPGRRAVPALVAGALVAALQPVAVLAPAALAPAGLAPTGLLPVAQAAPARTRLTLKAPKKAYTSARVTLTGKVAPASPRRTVQLHARKNGRWKKVASVRTDTKGRFTLKTSAPAKPTTRTYRVTVRATSTRAKAVATRKVKVIKAPPAAQTPTPSPADFKAVWAQRTVQVDAKARLTATGTLPGVTGRKRKVVVQRKQADGWATVSRSRTDAKGRFTVTVPANWLFSLKHRVYVPATSKARKRFSQASTLNVTPTWVPQGSSNDYSLLRDAKTKGTYRWNSCQGAITYRINTAQAPAFVTPAFIQEAVSEVAQATGLQFTHRGSTSVHAFPADEGNWPTDTDLVISWTKDHQTARPFKDPGVLGRGGLAGYRSSDARGAVFNATRGHVTINATSPYITDDPDATFGVLKHELTHAVGLDHAPSGRGEQLMDAYLDPERGAAYGAGDLAGLRTRGVSAGCIKVWAFSDGAVRAPVSSGLLPIGGDGSGASQLRATLAQISGRYGVVERH